VSRVETLETRHHSWQEWSTRNGDIHNLTIGGGGGLGDRKCGKQTRIEEEPRVKFSD